MNPQDSQIHFCAVGRLAHARKSTFQARRSTVRPPGEELNATGERDRPAPGGDVIVLRGGADALELLLVKRTPQARFMGGVWVFPGGAVDAHEGEGDAAHRVAAVRELRGGGRHRARRPGRRW